MVAGAGQAAQRPGLRGLGTPARHRACAVLAGGLHAGRVRRRGLPDLRRRSGGPQAAGRPPGAAQRVRAARGCARPLCLRRLRRLQPRLVALLPGPAHPRLHPDRAGQGQPLRRPLSRGASVRAGRAHGPGQPRRPGAASRAARGRQRRSGLCQHLPLGPPRQRAPGRGVRRHAGRPGSAAIGDADRPDPRPGRHRRGARALEPIPGAGARPPFRPISRRPGSGRPTRKPPPRSCAPSCRATIGRGSRMSARLRTLGWRERSTTWRHKRKKRGSIRRSPPARPRRSRRMPGRAWALPLSGRPATSRRDSSAAGCPASGPTPPASPPPAR